MIDRTGVPDRPRACGDRGLNRGERGRCGGTSTDARRAATTERSHPGRDRRGHPWASSSTAGLTTTNGLSRKPSRSSERRTTKSVSPCTRRFSDGQGTGAKRSTALSRRSTRRLHAHGKVAIPTVHACAGLRRVRARRRRADRARALLDDTIRRWTSIPSGTNAVHSMLGDVAERLGDHRVALQYFVMGMDEHHWIGRTKPSAGCCDESVSRSSSTTPSPRRSLSAPEWALQRLDAHRRVNRTTATASPSSKPHSVPNVARRSSAKAARRRTPKRSRSPTPQPRVRLPKAGLASAIDNRANRSPTRIRSADNRSGEEDFQPSTLLPVQTCPKRHARERPHPGYHRTPGGGPSRSWSIMTSSRGRDVRFLGKNGRDGSFVVGGDPVAVLMASDSLAALPLRASRASFLSAGRGPKARLMVSGSGEERYGSR